jgi:hypothetical protein
MVRIMARTAAHIDVIGDALGERTAAPVMPQRTVVAPIDHDDDDIDNKLIAQQNAAAVADVDSWLTAPLRRAWHGSAPRAVCETMRTVHDEFEAG